MEPLPAGRDASSGVGVPPYVRHRPERTLPYQLVRDYYPAFKAHLAAQGSTLPPYVEQEFDDYLTPIYAQSTHRCPSGGGRPTADAGADQARLARCVSTNRWFILPVLNAR